MYDPKLNNSMSFEEFKEKTEEEWKLSREDLMNITKEWNIKACNLYESEYKNITHAYFFQTIATVSDSIIHDIIYLETNLRIDQFLRALNSYGLLDDKNCIDSIQKIRTELIKEDE